LIGLVCRKGPTCKILLYVAFIRIWLAYRGRGETKKEIDGLEEYWKDFLLSTKVWVWTTEFGYRRTVWKSLFPPWWLLFLLVNTCCII
jgi:hypothetical protein